MLKVGAGRRIRTDDLLITNQLLYQLSYAGDKTGEGSAALMPKQDALPDLGDGGASLLRTPGVADLRPPRHERERDVTCNGSALSSVLTTVLR